MLSIGSFTFPKETTVSHVRMIEAKSKVRKEIQLVSVIKGKSGQDLNEKLYQLQNAIESFDHRNAGLSLTPGRYYFGRRRRFEITFNAGGDTAFTDLILFTEDRYERSIVQHQVDFELFYGQTQFTVYALGNWQSNPLFELTCKPSLHQIRLICGGETLTLDMPVNEEQTILVDPENRKVLVDGNENTQHAEGNFPILAPGKNKITVHAEPQTAQVKGRVLYRDVWV